MTVDPALELLVGGLRVPGSAVHGQSLDPPPKLLIGSLPGTAGKHGALPICRESTTHCIHRDTASCAHLAAMTKNWAPPLSRRDRPCLTRSRQACCTSRSWLSKAGLSSWWALETSAACWLDLTPPSKYLASSS